MLLYSLGQMYVHVLTFTFNHLTDAFVQHNLAVKTTKEQQYLSAVTSTVHIAKVFLFCFLNRKKNHGFA